MRRLIAFLVILAVAAGGGLWIWRQAQARGAEQAGSALEPFGSAGYAGLEVQVRAAADEQGTRLAAVWERTATVGATQLGLSGTLRYADEPVVRTDFRGRRAIAQWTEQGAFGGHALEIRGEWTEAAATAGALGAEMRMTRRVRWGEAELEVEGQGRATADGDGATGVYAEHAVVGGLPVLTVIRFELRPSGSAVDVTWTRRTEVGSGEQATVYENTGSYSGPALPLPVILTPYELLMLLVAAEEVN